MASALRAPHVSAPLNGAATHAASSTSLLLARHRALVMTRQTPAAGGGSIVADPSGKLWHMFVSRFVGNCGLDSWRQNSQIIRATSTDPEGPYTLAEVVLPVFSHGPSVRKLNDGSGYMMMHLGCGRSFMKQIEGCTAGETPPQPPVSQCTSSGGCCNQFNVSVMTAPSLNNSWSHSRQVFLSSGSQNSSWYVPSGRQFSNPAPHINPDGSLLCAYRADARGGGEHVSVAKASSPFSLYTDGRAEAAVATHTGEDPFLWQDERGHWHMLMHNMGGGVGSHAFSRDAETWTRSDVMPYTRNVTFADGHTHSMLRRERPQLLLDTNGRPLYFSSGVVTKSDRSYTLVMKFNK